MYYHFLRKITTETNFYLILSSNDGCFQVIIYFWFRLSIYPVHSKTELIYRELQVYSQQELGIFICYTLSINIVNACFDHCYTTYLSATHLALTS